MSVMKPRQTGEVLWTAWNEVGEANSPILITTNIANGSWINSEHDGGTPESAKKSL